MHLHPGRVRCSLCCIHMLCGLTLSRVCCHVYRGHPHSYYQKALLSNGVTSALRLHQRVPHFQFSREYFGRLFLEDSAHYLFYSLIFVTGPPVSSILASLQCCVVTCKYIYIYKYTVFKDMLTFVYMPAVHFWQYSLTFWLLFRHATCK